MITTNNVESCAKHPNTRRDTPTFQINCATNKLGSIIGRECGFIYDGRLFPIKSQPFFFFPVFDSLTVRTGLEFEAAAAGAVAGCGARPDLQQVGRVRFQPAQRHVAALGPQDCVAGLLLLLRGGGGLVLGLWFSCRLQIRS